MHKKWHAMLLLFFLFLSWSTRADADNRRLVVYIASGSSSAVCYHARATCPSLSRSVVGAVSLEEAVSNGLNPCSICKPEEKDFEVEATPRPKQNQTNNWDSFQSSESQRTPLLTDNPQIWKGTDSFIGIVACVSAIAVISLVFIIRKIIRANRENKERKNQEEARKKQWEKQKEEYEKRFGGCKSTECVEIPADSYIGEDGLPYSCDGNGLWGEKYTFFITSSGRCYHKAKCKVFTRAIMKPINAAQIVLKKSRNEEMYSPCSYCNPILPDLEWYKEYKHIKDIREKYEIPEP